MTIEDTVQIVSENGLLFTTSFFQPTWMEMQDGTKHIQYLTKVGKPFEFKACKIGFALVVFQYFIILCFSRYLSSNRTHYEILEVSKDATDEEIKAAYKRLSKKVTIDTVITE